MRRNSRPIDSVPAADHGQLTLAEIERQAILQTLERTNGNKRAAASILGVYRPTLYGKLRKYKLGEYGAASPKKPAGEHGESTTERGRSPVDRPCGRRGETAADASRRAAILTSCARLEESVACLCRILNRMSPGSLSSGSSHTASLVDILDRVLDKGLVVAGDIKISLAEVELLTIRIRLLICSIDKAEQIGMDWWKYDRNLSPGPLEPVA